MVSQNVSEAIAEAEALPGISTLLSFLAFEEESSPVASSNKDGDNPQASPHSNVNQPPMPSTAQDSTANIGNHAALEKATIVYHESAISIVFRDQIRREHNHAKQDGSATKSKRKMRRRHRSRSKSNASIMSAMSESSDASPKSPSAPSVGNTAHAVCSGSVASSMDDHQTFSNGTIECDNSHPNIESNFIDSDAKPTVVIANYTPQIDPLPPLELEPHNEFSELLMSDPYKWEEGEGPEEAVCNDTIWSTLSDAEKTVVDMMLKQKCAVKTIKHDDLTAFVSKFPVKKGEKAKRWMHPIDFKDATKMEKIQNYKESQLEFNSFFTSLSLLPACGLKMRCYGSVREYPLGAIFALPETFGEESEDSAAIKSHSWSWPAGYAAKTEFNIARNGALINGREEALVSISQLRKMNHSYIYDKDYGEHTVFWYFYHFK
jgi:hypothetical protein